MMNYTTAKKKHSSLQSVLQALDLLCKEMDGIISQECKYNPLLILEMEQHNWEICRTKTNIESMKERYGE